MSREQNVILKIWKFSISGTPKDLANGGLVFIVLFLVVLKICNDFWTPGKKEQGEKPADSPSEPEPEPASNEEGQPLYRTYKPSEAFVEENNLRFILGPVPEGFDALVYGPKGSMKSFFALGSLIQLLNGTRPEAFPLDQQDYRPNKTYCIFADGENGQAVIKERLSYFGSSLDDSLEIVEAKQFGNSLDSFFEYIKSRCILQPSGTSILFGVDNMKSLLNDQNASEVRRYPNKLRMLREQLKAYGISFTSLTVHHTEKTGEKASGSYNLTCLLPYVFRLEKVKDTIILTVEENRTGPKGIVYGLKVQSVPYTHLVFDHEVVGTDSNAQSKEIEIKERYETVKKMREENKPWKEITEETGVSNQLFQSWKKKFKEV